jgi:hypothetical protein
MILVRSINLPQTLDILDKHLILVSCFFLALYLLWEFCDTHIFDLQWRAILSLPNPICDEDSLAIVKFITEANNRGMPNSIDLATDQLGRKAPGEAAREIVDIKRDSLTCVLGHLRLGWWWKETLKVG